MTGYDYLSIEIIEVKDGFTYSDSQGNRHFFKDKEEMYAMVPTLFREKFG